MSVCRTPPKGWTLIEQGDDGFAAQLGFLRVIASWGDGWDHVSISLADRCPTWDEMCLIKLTFFDRSDCVVQYHPPERSYVNCHPFCLHLWRPQDQALPRPPAWMVGPMQAATGGSDVSERPKCYKDWRALYQRELQSFGYGIFVNRKLHDTLPANHVIVRRHTRRIEQQYRRLKRIRKQLDAEWETMDSSCVSAVIEAAFGKGGAR